VKSGKPITEVGGAFSIAESTIRLRLKTGCTKCAQLSINPTVFKEQEREMTDYILKLANVFCDLKPRASPPCMVLLRLTVLRTILTNQSKQSGKYWLDLLLKRNPRINLSKLGITRFNRINSINHCAVKSHFHKPELVT
jgi:hypothetical protein